MGRLIDSTVLISADSPSRRARRAEFVEAVLAVVPVVPVTLAVARAFGELDTC